MEKIQKRAISIYYKTITYMYRFETNRGFLLYPCSKKESDKPFFSEDLYIDGNAENRILEKIGMTIPQHTESFGIFASKMGENERALMEYFLKKCER